MMPKATDSTIEDRMAAVGFVPPADSFMKHDPRGAEYGTFTASVAPRDSICVTWQSNAAYGGQYTMVFRELADFETWAREVT